MLHFHSIFKNNALAELNKERIQHLERNHEVEDSEKNEKAKKPMRLKPLEKSGEDFNGNAKTQQSLDSIISGIIRLTDSRKSIVDRIYNQVSQKNRRRVETEASVTKDTMPNRKSHNSKEDQQSIPEERPSIEQRTSFAGKNYQRKTEVSAHRIPTLQKEPRPDQPRNESFEIEDVMNFGLCINYL